MRGSARIDRAAHLAIAVYAVLQFLLISGSWYRDDDFVYIWETTRPGQLWHVMFTPYVGHLLPGDFFMTWLTQLPAAMNWTINAGVTAVALVVAAILSWKVLRSLLGTRPLTLVLLIAYLTSGTILLTSVWWAAAVEYVPLLIGVPAMILLLQRSLRSPGRRNDLLPALALVATLLFFEKTLIYVPFLVALVAIAPLTADAPNTPGARLRRAARPLAMLLVAATVYGTVFLVATSGQSRGVALSPAIIWHLSPKPALHTLFPNLIGVQPVVATIAGTTTGLITEILAAAALVALLLRSARRTTNWYAPWLVLAALIMVNIVLLAAAHRPAESSVRYWSDLVFPMLLLVGLSQDGSQFDTIHRRQAPAVTEDSRSGLRLRSWSSLAILAFTAFSLVGLLRANAHAPIAHAEPYVANALRSADRIGTPITLLPEQVPQDVMLALLEGRNNTQTVLQPSSGSFTFADWTTDPYTVLDSGEIVPARVRAALRSQDDAGSNDTCHDTVRRGTPATLHMTGEPAMRDEYGLLDYHASKATTLVIRWRGGSIEVPVGPGRGNVTFAMPTGDRSTVRVASIDGNTCIWGLTIGDLERR